MRRSIIGLALLWALGYPAEGAAPQASQPGDLWIAYSTDGVTFAADEARLVAPAAMQPDMIVARDGRWIVYAVDRSETTPGAPERIVAFVSSNIGRSWQRQDVTINGLTGRRTLGPDAVILRDGRIRLFYYAPDTSALHSIKSAISQDGLNFHEEAGLRFSAPGISDPDVIVRPDGTWLMYCAVRRQGEQPGVVLARSQHGINFEPDTFTLNATGGASGSMNLPQGGVRLYLADQGAVSSHIAEDGRFFSLEGVSLDGVNPSDPTPFLLPDGRFALVFSRPAAR